MYYVLITSALIALFCAVGAVTGFLFINIRPELEDSLSGAAAGIMLCAAVLGLVLPSVEYSGGRGAYLPAAGILCGALFLSLINRTGPRLCSGIGMTTSAEEGSRALLFVLAIAIHHFPEGIAAGVSFGTGDMGDTVTVVSGIAFQNLPESMVMIPPLLKSGVKKHRAVIAAVISGLIEVLGVFVGYFAITLSKAIMPFALAFAAGTMLFVIADDLVPQSHARGNGRLATYSLLIGFCIMLAVNWLF